MLYKLDNFYLFIYSFCKYVLYKKKKKEIDNWEILKSKLYFTLE